MLKPTVQLRIGQTLTMTPQLQQAIRLLQLSTLELQAQIQETLDSNPMLELAEDADADVVAQADESSKDDEQIVVDAHEFRHEEPIEPDSFDSFSSRLDAERASKSTESSIPEELPVDSSWEDIYDVAPASYVSPDMEDRDIYENQTTGGDTLAEHLLWQIHLSQLTERDKVIAHALIDSINEDGYLTDCLKNIQAGLANTLDELDIDEIEAVLRMIQHLDPIGTGARDLSECLLLQLEQTAAKTPHLGLARRLLKDHIEQLGARDFKGLCKTLNIEEPVLLDAIHLIQTLNPRPGGRVSNTQTEYIVPDVFVKRRQGCWQVELNPDIAPKLRVNSLYASFVRRADNSEDNNYLRNSLQEARWFIKSLQSRNETLLKVAIAIVEHQRGFLEYGDEAMKPLVLRDIAEQLEMHESTISRITTQKYIHTPRGIFEFKYFFSSHVGTADGGECSAIAIRAMIKKLIADEPSDKPMSDQKIANILIGRGIHVARRTVAKYREASGIPPSNERKRLY